MESAVAVLRGRAGTIAESIVRRAPAGSVALVFAGGSLARGAVWAASFDGILEVYSDIDLYVVVEDASRLEEVRAAARAAIAGAVPEEEGVRFLRGVDAGVYTREDLRAQPMRPGTADLSLHHLVFHGDARRVAALLPPVRRMEPVEALHLLENRAWDALERGDGDPGRVRLRRVMSLKLDLDIACAGMIAAGMDAAAVSDPVAVLRAGSAPGIEEGVRAAGLRAAGARDGLDGFLRTPDQDEARSTRACRAWLALAPRVLEAAGADAGTLLARRSRAGHRLANLCEFVRVAGCVRMSRAAALAVGLRCSARSPRTALSVHPIARALEESGGGDQVREHVAYAERVTSALGFGAGSLDERVRAAHLAIW